MLFDRRGGDTAPCPVVRADDVEVPAALGEQVGTAFQQDRPRAFAGVGPPQRNLDQLVPPAFGSAERRRQRERGAGHPGPAQAYDEIARGGHGAGRLRTQGAEARRAHPPGPAHGPAQGLPCGRAGTPDTGRHAAVERDRGGRGGGVQVGEQFLVAPGDVLRRVPFGVAPGGAAHGAAQVGVLDEPEEAPGDAFAVARGDEQAVLAVPDDLGGPVRAVRGDHGSAALHGFHDGHAERLLT
ncbi:hypothetical protein GCM10010252_37900 [Streptomyces aureoverticillatus]|nr:hypothetical protein GCM10010252_37900 [Streptomyces aureoverticillatus]